MSLNASLIAMIGSAVAAARQMGLGDDEQRAAACAVLVARDESLTPGIARILVDTLYDAELAAA